MNNGHLSPALERCLFAHRKLCDEKGRCPTAGEMSEALDGIRKESVCRAVEKLAIRGYRIPLSLEWCRNGGVRGPKDEPQDAAEQEKARIVALLRLADRLVSRYGDPEDCEWRRFREESSLYLKTEVST